MRYVVTYKVKGDISKSKVQSSDASTPEEAIAEFDTKFKSVLPYLTYEVVSVSFWPSWMNESIVQILTRIADKLYGISQTRYDTSTAEYLKNALDFEELIVLGELSGVQDTIEALTGHEVHYIVEDSYYGICDEKEDLLIYIPVSK